MKKGEGGYLNFRTHDVGGGVTLFSGGPVISAAVSAAALSDSASAADGDEAFSNACVAKTARMTTTRWDRCEWINGGGPKFGEE